MNIASKFAAVSGAVVALSMWTAAAFCGDQAMLRSQTDEVQRAISEAVRQASSGLRRRDAAALQPPPSDPGSAIPERDEAPTRPAPDAGRH